MEIVILVGALALFIGLIVWAVKYTKKINARKEKFFKDFALENSLSYDQRKEFFIKLNSVEGQLSGCQFQLYEHLIRSGKNKQVVTYVKFSNAPFTFDFKIGKEHLFSKTGKLLGMKDIEFSDEKFDKTFLLKSKAEDEFRGLMTYDMQQALTQIEKDLKATIMCRSGELSYNYMAPLANEKAFTSCQSVIKFMQKLINSAK